MRSCVDCPVRKFANVNFDAAEIVACTNSQTLTCPKNSGMVPGYEGCATCIDSFNDGDRLYCKCNELGKYYNAQGNCDPCARNTFCGLDNDCAGSCEICPSGKFMTLRWNFATGCTSLDSSQDVCPRSSGAFFGQHGCYVCPSTKFNDGTQLYCTSCPLNLVQDPTASASGPFCVCPEGSSYDIQSASCYLCVSGKYKSRIGNGACDDCAIGRYMTIDKECSTDSHNCSTCPHG